ncbi:hypothetical protein MBRA_47160 [Mycobacterium branderi]|uniref:Transposase IS200-like domain-containing protein n=1 Tax=Mycobacterium branderi TaxID=43348 RepID=A0ABM7KU01_9MYCO|nr:hypothetical protein MBRA_47160 [Mycobacterium branderi]
MGLRLVWCPKYRRRALGGRVLARCGELAEQIADGHGWEVVAKEVMPEFAYLRRLVELLRSPSYFAAAVGYVSEAAVRRCIGHQWGVVAA